MKVRIRPNVAINTAADANARVADFYRSLGLEGNSIAPDFTVLSPSPFGCYVVSWDPPPQPPGEGEICLQLETDDLPRLRDAIVRGGGAIEFFGDDPNAPGKQHLWFRDPSGCLINAVEM